MCVCVWLCAFLRFLSKLIMWQWVSLEEFSVYGGHFCIESSDLLSACPRQPHETLVRIMMQLSNLITSPLCFPAPGSVKLGMTRTFLPFENDWLNLFVPCIFKGRVIVPFFRMDQKEPPESEISHKTTISSVFIHDLSP